LAIAEFDDPMVLRVLLEAIHDDDANIQSAAVRALGGKGDDRASEPLRELRSKTRDSRLQEETDLALSMIRELKTD
jgi:HEAT repeat protein